jgi:hypothetical protein
VPTITTVGGEQVVAVLRMGLYVAAPWVEAAGKLEVPVAVYVCGLIDLHMILLPCICSWFG